MLLVDYLRGSFWFSVDELRVEVLKANPLSGLSNFLQNVVIKEKRSGIRSKKLCRGLGTFPGLSCKLSLG